MWKIKALELGNTKDTFILYLEKKCFSREGSGPSLGRLNPETAGTALMSVLKAEAAANTVQLFDLPFSQGRVRLSRIPMKLPRNFKLVNVFKCEHSSAREAKTLTICKIVFPGYWLIRCTGINRPNK